MTDETHRLLKTFIYKLLIYFPVTIILAYAFYRDFVKDIGFASASIGIGIILYYLFDWVWQYKKTKKNIAIGMLIGWILLVTLSFVLTGIDYSKHHAHSISHDADYNDSHDDNDSSGHHDTDEHHDIPKIKKINVT
jgi:hypothetical protein